MKNFAVLQQDCDLALSDIALVHEARIRERAIKLFGHLRSRFPVDHLSMGMGTWTVSGGNFDGEILGDGVYPQNVEDMFDCLEQKCAWQPVGMDRVERDMLYELRDLLDYVNAHEQMSGFDLDFVILKPLEITEEMGVESVRKMLNKATEHLHDEGGFSTMYKWHKALGDVKKQSFYEALQGGFIAVYHVEGGSEGHYIHIDAIGATEDGTLKGIPLFLLKTFEGTKRAQEIQDLAQILLGV